jgi:hypothetical protein
MTVQVFLSHTKLDIKCCDQFGVAASLIGLKVFRSEFEKIEFPAWKTIKDAINNSSALFLMVGKELTEAQQSSETDAAARENWKHTQNWIAYEIGVACQRGIDVWVICDSVNINFPVPYLNNYDTWGIRKELPLSLAWIKWVFDEYNNGRSMTLKGHPGFNYKCTYCGAVFNLHSELPKGMQVPCPTCLKAMSFPDGWMPRFSVTT